MNIRFLFFLFFISVIAHAQLTISGKVLDEQNQPLPFVNIILKNSTIGTVTDDNGAFTLTINEKRGRIEISYVGYISQVIRINSKKKYLTIILKEEANQLGEVVIVTRPKKRLKKKENPAYRILKEIWKRKKSNGLKLVDYYQYKKHQTVEVGLNNLDSVFLKKIFKKDFDKAVSEIKYDNDGINYYIPVFLKETIYNVYGNNKTKEIRTDIEAEKSKGVPTQGFIFDRMTNTFRDYNFYDNNILILNKTFVSPISTAGFETYDYVLHDSTIVKNRKHYHIYFFPRRNGDFAFEGNFWVSEKSFSITKMKMKVHKDINLNFVRSFTFEKEFVIKNDSIYLPKSNLYEGDFTLLDKNEKNKGLTIRKTNTFTNYILDEPQSADFYKQEIVKYTPKQFLKPEKYWKKNSKAENTLTYQIIENVKNKKKIKNLTGIINTLASGFINISSSVQLGPFWTFFARNEVEGLIVKAGARSFKTIHDRFRFNGYLAYGFKDKKAKFAIESKYLLTYKPRISAGLAYVYDNEQLGSKLLNTNQLIGNTFGTGALVTRGDNFFLSKINKLAANVDFQVKQNFNIGINMTHNSIVSAAPDLFSIDYLNENNTISSSVKDVSTDIYLSLTPGRFIYGLGVEQRYGRILFSTFILNYRRGYKGFLNGTTNYDKIQFLYNQPIFLGKSGLLDATIEGGKTFGTVPLTLLNPIPANQTLSLVRNTFALINYYDFVTDTYAATHLEHHFNGFILNRIPLLKKLKLRSLVTFRVAYGTISDANIAINRSSIQYNAPSNRLYYEYSVGLENIGFGNIRFLRIDAIWRSNYTQVNTTIPQTPKFAIRIGIRPGL
ncbi:MAG: carboxypeptidase-like regulatory domain-containing protein [Flavobacteriaceae bacterium]|nr:MAG: carboxypeptidase-like regulatory domain-containing protein [Flavobacteriaceae bacterium]